MQAIDEALQLGKGVVAFVRATLGFEQEIMRQGGSMDCSHLNLPLIEGLNFSIGPSERGGDKRLERPAQSNA